MHKHDEDENAANHDNRSLTPQVKQFTRDEMGTTRKGRSHLCFIVWNKNEFNIRNDLNAFDYLLNLEGFGFTVMSLEAAKPLQFKREETYSRLDEKLEVEKILEDRWREQNPQDEMRVIWDLALVEAYLNPAMANLETVTTPPENKQRSIRAYIKINEKALANDFWNVLK